jgi:hypothetical protein
MEEPELLEQIEDAFLAKLRTDAGVPGLQVTSAPDKPNEWTAAAAVGCMLVQYAGARYLEQGPRAAGRPFPQKARFRIWIGAPTHRPSAEHIGAYRLLACAKRAILGSERLSIQPLLVTVPGPRNEGALMWTPKTVGFYDELNEVWWYVLEFESSPFVEEL